MEHTDIRLPPSVQALLEATALANGLDPEEVILAAIEAFLDFDESDRESAL